VIFSSPEGLPDSVPWSCKVVKPSASCIAFLGPGSPAGKLPTGSVAVRCPDQSRDRAGRWILLADARHRVGGIPGLTNLLLRGYLGRESEVSALNLGTYEVCGHSINEVMSAVLGSLPLDQLLKSNPIQVVYKGFTPAHIIITIRRRNLDASPRQSPNPPNLVHEQSSILTHLKCAGPTSSF